MRVLHDGGMVRATGELDRRLRLGLRRVVDDPSVDRSFVLEDLAHRAGYERQFEEWCGDISGRFIGLFSSVASYVGESHPGLAPTVEAILALQRPDGRFGVDTPTDTLDFPMIWGHGRLLIGLMDYWHVTKQHAVLDVARRLGDYYRQTLDLWRSPQAVQRQEYMFYCQGLEGMVALHRATGEPGYREVANVMADGIRPAPWWHSHGYLSALRGALDLYEVTHDVARLDFVQARCAEIAATHLLPDGTPPELFPWSLRDEGCSTADWLRLQLHLGTITGQARFFDAAETSLLNGLFGNQSCLGGFCHHQFTPDSRPDALRPVSETDAAAMGVGLETSFRVGYTGLGVDAWWCCAYHGPLALYHAIRHTFGWDEDSIFVNLPIDARATLPHSSGEVQVEQKVGYHGPIRYRVDIVHAPPGGINLAIRRPAWATAATLTINGTPVDANERAGYVRTPSRIRTGDVIELEIPAGVRAEDWRGGREKTLWYGPFLLVPEVSGGHVSALSLPEPDVAGFIPLTRLEAPSRPWTVPGAHFAAVGQGQAMGETIRSIGRSRPEIVRLRPLSEQTGFPVVPPTALALPIFSIPPDGRLAAELQRASRAAALLGGVQP